MTMEKLNKWIDLENEQGDLIELSKDDPRYPFLLKAANDSPKVLFAKGNIELLNKPSVAIVGTRKPSPEGIAFARSIAKFCVENGFIVVSGLALGIDSEAMRAALDSGGKVVAVLPTIAEIVPKSNKNLADEILKKGGVLISENNTKKVNKGMYVKRNRIISGISTCVIVVEATLSGGTMHTVRFAKEMGRMVIVADLDAEGNRKLIDYGYPVFRKNK